MAPPGLPLLPKMLADCWFSFFTGVIAINPLSTVATAAATSVAASWLLVLKYIYLKFVIAVKFSKLSSWLMPLQLPWIVNCIYLWFWCWSLSWLAVLLLPRLLLLPLLLPPVDCCFIYFSFSTCYHYAVAMTTLLPILLHCWCFWNTITSGCL